MRSTYQTPSEKKGCLWLAKANNRKTFISTQINKINLEANSKTVLLCKPSLRALSKGQDSWRGRAVLALQQFSWESFWSHLGKVWNQHVLWLPDLADLWKGSGANHTETTLNSTVGHQSKDRAGLNGNRIHP